MSDYAVRVSVRNKRILRALRAAGYSSQMDFCRKTGFSYPVLNGFVAMRLKATARHNEWGRPAQTLALLLDVEPDSLFTRRQSEGFAVNSAEVEMTEEQVAGLMGQSNGVEALEAKRDIGRIISCLTEREQGIVTARMEGKTLSEVGESYGVNRNRIRQIEAKAMRKMRGFVHRTDMAVEQGVPMSQRDFERIAH
jgi:RNA polymerase sigma factor (sigma-70 family)